MKIEPSYVEAYDPAPAEAYLALGRLKKRQQNAHWFAFGAGLVALAWLLPGKFAPIVLALICLGSLLATGYYAGRVRKAHEIAREIDDHLAIVGQRLESKRS